MADLRITELTSLAGGDLAATDPLPIADLSASQTKKITAKAFVQQAVSLIDNASIPSAKVDFSGISGTQISAGTVAASKFDTTTIPATGGVTVSSSNLQLVAPTTPIVRNAGTGSLEHATSGVTAGTYTKVTVDTRGHVTVGAAIAAADLPIAVSGTVGVMSPGTGLSVTGGGVLNHTSSITAGTTTGFTYDAQGHITGAVALAGADLPIATSSVRGAVRPGTGLSVDGNGILDVTAATNAVLGGVIAGSDFAVSTGTISLAAQAGIAAGQYTKVTINSKGIATAGTVLSAGDIPNLAASQITSGSLDIARIAANTITGAKVANYAVTKIGDTQPTAEHIGQFFFNPLSRDLFLWDGNVFQPIGISVGEIIFGGTFDASAGGGTGHVASVTAEGTAIGLVEGSPLPAAATANNRYYLVVSESGTITSGNAPNVALAPPDIVLSTGIEWTEVDVSQTFTSVSASQVAFAPEGTIAANNVQAAIEEVNNEKLGLAGGTVTGNLEIGTAGSLSFEGSTANAFETTIAVVDPTADRTITLPNETGTVIVSGNASIVNADINASAAIAGSKIVAATTSVVGAVQLSDSTSTTSSVLAATPTAVKAAYDLANAALPKAGGTLTGNVILDNQVDARFREATANGTNYVGFQAPATIAADVLWTLPSVDGTSNQVLKTDGAGTLSWSTPTAGGVSLGLVIALS
jgi:YD repeat-containing protein